MAKKLLFSPHGTVANRKKTIGAINKGRSISKPNQASTSVNTAGISKPNISTGKTTKSGGLTFNKNIYNKKKVVGK